MPSRDVLEHHLRVDDHAAESSWSERAPFDLEREPVLGPHRRPRELEVGRVAAAAEPHDVVRPRLPEPVHDVVAARLDVALDRAREARHPHRCAERERSKNFEAHPRMREISVTPADDRDVVAALGEVERELVQVALRSARRGVTHVDQGDPHTGSVRGESALFTDRSPRIGA